MITSQRHERLERSIKESMPMSRILQSIGNKCIIRCIYVHISIHVYMSVCKHFLPCFMILFLDLPAPVLGTMSLWRRPGRVM